MLVPQFTQWKCMSMKMIWRWFGIKCRRPLTTRNFTFLWSKNWTKTRRNNANSWRNWKLRNSIFSFFNFNFWFLDDVANSTLPASPVLSSPASSQGILFNCVFLLTLPIPCWHRRKGKKRMAQTIVMMSHEDKANALLNLTRLICKAWSTLVSHWRESFGKV